MKARGSRDIQIIDPEDSALNEDPLWAPSWDLPSSASNPADRENEQAAFHAERSPLDRLGEGINTAR